MSEPQALAGDGPRPRFSVIIPTFQRRELATAAVKSLLAQTTEFAFEVIVAVDGSADGTAGALRALESARPLTVLEQANAGAAAARNLGARQARGEILLFVDDDMEAAPDLLDEHDRLHRMGADAVLGHMPLHPASAANVISEGVRTWTDERAARLSAPGAELGLHDLLTGQLSVSAVVFRAVGGFDAAFTQGGAFGNEDVDLGHRLLRGGYDIRFNPRAVSFQRYSVTPKQHLRQWRQAGAADVRFARKHPDEAMSLFRLNGLNWSFARRVARPLARLPFWEAATWPARALARRLARGSGRLAAYVFFRARALEYWRGVAEAGGVPWRKELTILAYHALRELPAGPLRPYGTPLEQLRGQLRSLKAYGFHLVGPEEFAAFIEGRAGLPRRAVMITFDDCYEDLLKAAPLLRAEGVGALAFAISGKLGGTNDWDAKHGGPALSLLDAEGLKRLRELGFEIGAHSRTHRELPWLAEDEITAEIRGSLEELEAAGLPRPRYFAFPYGTHDSRSRRVAAEAGLAAAFSITPGAVDEGSDRMALPRVEVLRSDVGLKFLAKVRFARQLGLAASGVQRVERRLRRVLRRG